MRRRFDGKQDISRKQGMHLRPGECLWGCNAASPSSSDAKEGSGDELDALDGFVLCSDIASTVGATLSAAAEISASNDCASCNCTAAEP